MRPGRLPFQDPPPDAWRANLMRCEMRHFEARHFASVWKDLERHNPPFGTKKQSSSPVLLLMKSTGKWSGVSSSLMMSGGTVLHWPSFRYCHWSERSSATLKRVLNTSPLSQHDFHGTPSLCRAAGFISCALNHSWCGIDG